MKCFPRALALSDQLKDCTVTSSRLISIRRRHSYSADRTPLIFSNSLWIKTHHTSFSNDIDIINTLYSSSVMKHLVKLFSRDKNDSHPFVRMEGALECRISDVRLWKLLQQNIHLHHKNREIYKLKPYKKRAKGIDVMRNHCA